MEKTVSCKIEEEEDRIQVKVEEQGKVIVQTSGKKGPRRRVKGGRNDEGYRWTNTQQQKYIQFLQLNQHLFDLSLEERRRLKVNKLMSQFVKSRDCLQCRSHHQKMFQKYGSIQAIIQSLHQLKSTKPSKRDRPGSAQRSPAQPTATQVKFQVKQEGDYNSKFEGTEEGQIVEVRPVAKYEIKMLKDDRIVEVKEQYLPEEGYIEYAQTS